MQEILRHLLHRVRQQDATVLTVSPVTDPPTSAEVFPPVPKPEFINIENHPLQVYPNFHQFVALWNEHATSATRLGFQQDIQLAQFEADKSPNESVALQEEVERQRAEQRSRQEGYRAQTDVPKREKIAPVKSANKRVERARQALDRVLKQERIIKKEKDDRLEATKASLINLDYDFAFNLDEETVRFYVVERLRDDQDALDSFLLKYIEQKKLNVREQMPMLRRINIGFFLLLQYYGDRVQIATYEEVKASAEIATKRQLEIARRSRLTSSQ